MGDEFLITEERLDIIAKAFGIEKDQVEKLRKELMPLEAMAENSHLAHMSRAIEHKFKELTGNPNFCIEFVPFVIKVPNGRNAMSTYDHRLSKFTIYYDKTLPVLEMRVNIAHELGHLYLSGRYWHATEGKPFVPKFERSTEPLSSILGLFMLSNKNHFYETLPSSGLQHKDWQSILDDFVKLKKN